MTAWVEILNEVREPADEDGWVLCFHRATYHYDNGSTDNGYRFIWRRPDGTLQAARGQARIPDAATHDRLIRKAKAARWFL